MARPEGNRQPRFKSAVHDSDVDRDTHPILQCAEVVPLHPRRGSDPGNDDPDHTAIVEIGSTTAPISIRPPSRDEHDRSAEWYVRLRLREDRLARLWVDGHTHKDILVWRDDFESWAPLLTVPQLRNAIHVQSSMMPAVPNVPEVVRREVAETAAASVRPSTTPSSCAPMVVDTDPVLIPAAPRVPSLAGLLPPETPVPAVPFALAPPSTDWNVARAGLAAAAGDRAHRFAARLSSLLPPGLQLSQAERLAWMAAVVAVASFAVVTASLRQRDHKQRTAVVATATTAPVATGAPIAVSPASSSERAASEGTDGEVRNAVGTRLEASGEPAKPDHYPVGRTLAATPRGPAGNSAATRAGPASATTAIGGANGFDKGAARLAAISAAQRVGACTQEPASGVVQLTFAPSGMVSNASIVALKGDSIRPDCVLRSFQAARINPFSGPPVTVQKSFVVK